MIVRYFAGRKYRLGELRFEFTIADPARRSRSALETGEVQGQFSKSELRAFFPIEEGDVFSTDKIRQGLDTLRAAYGKRGFINFSRVLVTKVDATNNLITVTLDIDEGSQFHIGHIEIAGLDAQIAGKLLAESGIRTGNVFDSSRVGEFRKQLRTQLSADFNPEEVERRLDGERETVDLVFYIYPCTPSTADSGSH